MLAALSGEYNWQVPASSSHVGQAIVFVACFSLAWDRPSFCVACFSVVAETSTDDKTRSSAQH